MKKIIALLTIFVMVMSLAACSSKDIDNLIDKIQGTTDAPKDDNNVAPTEQATPEPTQEPTKEPTSTPTPEPTEEVTATPEPTATDTPAPTDEPVVIGTDAEKVDEELLNKIFAAYTDYLHGGVEKDDYENFDTLRVGLALIDNDNIPELIFADNFYHACGVKVVFYNNGDLKEIGNTDQGGEFGEYGSFAYGKYDNRILSYYMGMGIQCLAQYHVEADLSLVRDFYLEGDVNENTYFKKDDSEIAADEFDLLYDQAFEGTEEHPVLWANYNSLIKYYPNLCQGNETEIFTDMYESLIDPEFVEYLGYKNPKMIEMQGTWSLKTAEISIDDPGLNIMYDIDTYDTEETTGEYSVLSEVVIGDFANIWLSAYDNDGNEIDDLTFASYAMPMDYFDGGISEAVDYGWCVICEPQDGLEWDCDMCLDNDDHLIVVMYRDTGKTYNMDGAEYPLQDWITLTYERVFYEYDYNTVTAHITRSPENDKDGKYAFKAEEYIFVGTWDEELIKEYGLPEDLDGNDYEIVNPGTEPYIFYIDEHTHIKIIDWEEVTMVKESVEDFVESRMYNEYTIFFDGVNDEGTNEGLTAVALYQHYIG